MGGYRKTIADGFRYMVGSLVTRIVDRRAVIRFGEMVMNREATREEAEKFFRICPKCGERGYDALLGRCFYCKYSAWSMWVSFKTARKLLQVAFILIVISLLLGFWLNYG